MGKLVFGGVAVVVAVVLLALWGFGVFNNNPKPKVHQTSCWVRPGDIDHRVNGVWVATYNPKSTDFHCNTKGAVKVNGQWVNPRTGLPLHQ